KSNTQWKRWRDNVIPSLTRPYLVLLSQTCCLCNAPTFNDPSENTGCACGLRKKLTVTSVSFFSINILWCKCQPTALQLLHRGIFPCSPVAPTLGVDIRLLEFVRVLFAQTPPDVTALSNTLNSF
ncbi:hypothetical protein SERLA73DRAFT_24124, partial [Serpula lacrymans var. lacrymans S7.3]